MFERAREVAEREGTTLRALVEEGLRHVLDRKRARRPFKLRDARYRGPCEGLTPEFAAAGWERVREAACEGRGG